jgi:hypothetical protein
MYLNIGYWLKDLGRYIYDLLVEASTKAVGVFNLSYISISQLIQFRTSSRHQF